MTELVDVLRGHHSPVAQCDFMTDDLLHVELSVPARVISGSVTTDRTSDAYASGSIALTNEDGELSPADLDSIVWPGRAVRLRRGALVDGAPELRSLMTGAIAQPGSGMASGAVSFSVVSRLALAKRRFAAPTTYAAGTRLRDVVRSILQLGGLGDNDALYDLQDRFAELSAARTFDNEEMLGSALKLAFDAGFDIWQDGDGVAHMAPFVDPDATNPAWDFTGSQTLTGLRRTVRTLGSFNRQDVYGRDATGYPIFARAVVTDPGSPLFWSTLNDRPAEDYRSPDITTQAAADAVARRLLYERATYEELIEAEAVPVPFLAARDVVLFGVAASGAWQLDRVEQPLYHGSMKMTARRVQSLIA